MGGSLHCSPGQYAPDGVQKILIGNKADEEHKRQVPKEQGLQVSGGCCVPPPQGAGLFLHPQHGQPLPEPPLHLGPRKPSCSPTSVWDPQASPVPPSMTRDPHPLAVCTQAPQKQLPQCLGTLFPFISAVVVHPQGSLIPTCKTFRDPLTSPCASSTVSCTPEEHSDLLGVPLGTS